ncbi:hypothetical protein XM38_033220 [Halomicronema hongdechloris C2206]|uniref:Uncharacterized protein n=1 Tax=Halomicronema hongdechloris C2206 TaxID=1641165 RepID=A0A1Z3HQ02_9CYAN|nr:hypothetical protein [Halomicronema hongdechloris]ASC72365.1 hypothetical protein XM38_033220 [Halomicronema hongdechloris C2206]
MTPPICLETSRPCRHPLPALALSLLLGVTGWAVDTTTQPPAVQAYTARVSLFLTREFGESYESLIQRAEITARAATQRSFDVDLLTTEVIVMVVGENQGLSVPILTLQVSRNQWRQRPDPQYWSTYYENAEALLDF